MPCSEGSVERATGTSDQLVETAGENELVVDEHEDVAKLGMDRYLGLLTFFDVGAQELDKVPADDVSLVGHASDGRYRALSVK